jgi:hypothetical protein
LPASAALLDFEFLKVDLAGRISARREQNEAQIPDHHE